MRDPLPGALLGGLSPGEFLRRHWQKRPLLVRGALPGFDGVVRRRALFALAARQDAEARLVQRSRGRDRTLWSVTHGPLGRAALPRRPRDWTLLVNGVNHFVPAAERLLRRFSFLPQARLDDVMVSYAVPGGGVGPHVDSYDVFLVQGAGRRRWQISRPRRYAMVEGAPLRLIDGFRAEQEWVLEPGDLLYLPPGWGHDGVALDECFTCSVGFRAPGGAELAASFLDDLHERGLPEARYADPSLRPARRPAQINAELVSFAVRQARRIRWSAADVADSLGRHLTTPKPHVVFLRPTRRAATPLARAHVRLDARTQLLYRGARFYLNGEAFTAEARQRAVLAALADHRESDGADLARAGLALRVEEWRAAGYLHLDRRSR